MILIFAILFALTLFQYSLMISDLKHEKAIIQSRFYFILFCIPLAPTLLIIKTIFQLLLYCIVVAPFIIPKFIISKYEELDLYEIEKVVEEYEKNKNL